MELRMGLDPLIAQAVVVGRVKPRLPCEPMMRSEDLRLPRVPPLFHCMPQRKGLNFSPSFSQMNQVGLRDRDHSESLLRFHSH